MLNLFKQKSIPLKEIEIKVFGGSDMFQDLLQISDGKNVGEQNILMSKKLILEENMTIKASDTGGKQGRRLFFFSGTGDVYIKKIKNLSQLKIEERLIQ